MLNNGGFEADWGEDSSHWTLVFPVDGTPYDTEIGNIFTPSGGWYTWFRHGKPDDWHDPQNPEGYCQPEVRDSWITGDPVRVAEGQKAMLLFTFYRCHDAGFLQQVSVEPGQLLTLNAQAHAWSNFHGGPHVDDPRWSEGPGYDAGYMLEGTAPNDDWRNFTFTLGIDPTGGSNPFASTVVWGQGAHIYNQHAQVPEVEVVAESEYATVFLRSRTLWAFKHNDAYWDDVRLQITETRRYESTRVLFGPGTIDDHPDELEHHTDAQHTICQSADDVAVRGEQIEDLTVYSYGTNEWDGGAIGLRNFFDTYYADNIDTLIIEGEEPPPPSEGIYLWQCHPSYASVPIPNCTGTICTTGCFITNVASAQRFYEIDVNATPETLIEALGSGYFYRCQLLYYGNYADGFAERTGLTIERRWFDEDAIEWLAQGKCAMAAVAIGTNEHWVFTYTYDEAQGDFWVHDPYRDQQGWLKDMWPRAIVWRLIDKADVEPPPPDPEPRLTRGHLGLHLQVMEAAWMEYHQNLHPAVAKVFSFHDVHGIRRNSEHTAVVVRHYHGNNYGELMAQEPDARRAAEIWVGYFRDALFEECARLKNDMPYLSEPLFYVEAPNEWIGTFDPNRDFRLEVEWHFCDVILETGLPIAPACLCLPIGNPNEAEFEALVPLARKVEQSGGMLGYHNYVPVHNGHSYLEGQEYLLYSGRWVNMDEVFVANGVHVKWYGGEGGAVGMNDHGGLTPNDGWKSHWCFNGDWDAYLNKLLLPLDEKILIWNREHEDRYLGGVIFTTDYGGWELFYFGGDEMDGLATALLERYGHIPNGVIRPPVQDRPRRRHDPPCYI